MSDRAAGDETTDDAEVTEPHEDTPISPPGVQDGPALAMHETDEAKRLDGLIAQLRADLNGENAAVVEHAVRRRLDQVGLALDESRIAEIVADLSVGP